MDKELVEKILLDQELTAYLQGTLEEGCELNYLVRSSIKLFFDEVYSRQRIFDNLEAEWKFQMEVK